MCRGRRARVLLHLHLQLEGTVLRGSRAGRRFGCRNHPSCVHGSDLSGGRRTMTGSDDDAPAARGLPLGARVRRSDGRESSRAWRPADFPGP
jgi:hypothetical protein